MSGEEARAGGLPEADLTMSYLRIHLPRPVPRDGGIRLLIDKTYQDPQSYRRTGTDRIVFSRTLGIRRNAIVLLAGYELTACNAPAQVLTEPDGRFAVSFLHSGRRCPAISSSAGLAPRRSPPSTPGSPA